MARRSSHPRSLTPVVVSLALVSLFAAAVGLAQITDFPGLIRSWASDDDWDGSSLRRSAPTRISIPSLGVRAGVVEVGRADDGSIATPQENPAETTGWYGQGPSPGEPGTSIIVGHVDTQSQPAVFHNLSDLREGKFIEVKRSDRRVATFAVRSVETFAKTSFPADRIFAETDEPRLALVTCGGAWVGGDIGYADNVIVFATLA